MRKVILPIIILSLFLSTGVLAQEAELPDPGLTPDSPFYFLKTCKESIQTFFIFGAENKAKQFLHLADVRLAEYQKMIEKGKTEIAEKTLEKYEKQLNHALEKAEETKAKGKDVEKIVNLISEKTLKHQEVLLEVLNKVPEQAKKGIENAIEMSQKGFENAIQTVSGEKKKELEKKAEEIKIRIEEKIKIETIIPKEKLEQEEPQESPKIPASPIETPKPITPDKPAPTVCIQVITPAISPEGICKQFPTPCEVPAGWKKVDACPKPMSSPTPTPTPTKSPATCPQATSFEQLIPAVGPDGTCKKFMTNCSIPANWKKVNSCPPMTFTQEMTGCCAKGANMCVAKPRYDCLFQGGREVPFSTCDIADICFYLADEPKMIVMTPGGVVSPTPTPEACPQTATWAVGPDGTCKEFPTPCHVYVGWKKVSQCPAPIAAAPLPKRIPSGICAPGEIINYTCADGTSVKWCVCNDLGWDCPMYKYPQRLCPATKEITLETGQHPPATCAIGEALNTKCSDGRIFRACICDERNSWECGLEPICPKPGSPVITSVSLSGAVTSDLSVELGTTQFGTVRITWFTSEPATSLVEYGQTTAYGFTAGPDYFGSTYQGVELSNLQQNITYHFRIKTKDKDITPNTFVSKDYTFIIRKLPDLAIFPISVDHFNADTSNKIHVKIENNGVATASKGFVVRVYVDDILVGEGAYDSDLASGASGEKIFDYTFSGAKSYAIIKAAVDATNLVTELNENNNEMQYTISLY